MNANNISLNQGEIYVGLVAASDNAPAYHLVLTPASASNLTWEQAVQFAATANATLPSNTDWDAIVGNSNIELTSDYFWSSTEVNARFAWALNSGESPESGDGESEQLFDFAKMCKFSVRTVRKVQI